MSHDFVTIPEAQKILGKSSQAATDMWLRRRGVERLTHPSDLRRVVFRRSDLDQFAMPTPRSGESVSGRMTA